jgi:ribosomal protein S20
VLRDDFLNTLAGKLGVSVDTLQQALDAVRQEDQQQAMTNFNNRIDQAVAKGTLPQAEGDAVKSAAAKGVLGPTAKR